MNKFLPFSECLLISISIYTGCFSSCIAPKSNQVAAQHIDSVKTFVLKYERGPCFGQCPVYSFYLLSDHTALVNAKANLMDTPGWYHATPDQEDIVEILELIEPAAWWIRDLRDQPEIADLPHVNLVYNHPEGMRTLTIQSRTTDTFEEVFGKLTNIVTESIWKTTGMRPQDIMVPEPLDLIVQLKAGVDINEWMKKFDRFGIQLKKRLTPNQQYYLITRAPQRGNANDLLQYIKLDPDVVDAQWDRQVKTRH